MKILLFGKVREDNFISELNIDINNILTFNKILNIINSQINLESYNNLMYSLNHEYVQYDNFLDTKVNNDDIIGIIPPINAG